MLNFSSNTFNRIATIVATSPQYYHDKANTAKIYILTFCYIPSVRTKLDFTPRAMARIFITGSSDGLGLLAARSLISQGHAVVLHARNSQRAEVARSGAPEAETCLIADLTSIEETKQLATQIDNIGPFDAIIHNARVGYQEAYRKTDDGGLPHIFAINLLPPYILTCLVKESKRWIYISLGLLQSGDPGLKDVGWTSSRK